jgi:hypothetical protein
MGRQTDRHGEANNRFSQFCKSSSNFKSLYFLLQELVCTEAANRACTFKSPVILKLVDLQKVTETSDERIASAASVAICQ